MFFCTIIDAASDSKSSNRYKPDTCSRVLTQVPPGAWIPLEIEADVSSLLAEKDVLSPTRGAGLGSPQLDALSLCSQNNSYGGPAGCCCMSTTYLQGFACG